MPLNPTALLTPGTPEYWMQYMAARLLDRNRTVRLATLQAYLAGTPPMLSLAASDRKGWYAFHKASRTNMARKVVRAKADRMRVRAIRTAATSDDLGDQVAWRYWRRSGLPAASKQVHDDQLALNEGYVRVSVTPDGQPIALRRDPRFCIAIEDPLDPLRTLAGFELLWDETTLTSYAYLWITGPDDDGVEVGQQWVAVAENTPRPRNVAVPGIIAAEARRFGWWWPNLMFDPSAFDMRPQLTDVAPADRDGGPYCQTIPANVVPLFRFTNRNDVGEFEEHLDVLDRINRTVCDRLILQAMQSYRQRILTQEASKNPEIPTEDRLPAIDPVTKETINWAELLQPGPDALMKLPPGVKMEDLAQADMKPIMQAAVEDMKTLGSATDTPLPLLSDDVNQSAEGAQYNREAHIFGTEDCIGLADVKWTQVIACMFLFAPDSDRYAPGGRGRPRIDRADPAQIILDWAPTERYSLAERADADSKNKTLSLDDAARLIWGLSPEDVAANRARRKADLAEIPMQFRPSELPQGEAANQVVTPPAGAPQPAPAAPEPAAAGQ